MVLTNNQNRVILAIIRLILSIYKAIAPERFREWCYKEIVELARLNPGEDLFDEEKHPYAAMLLSMIDPLDFKKWLLSNYKSDAIDYANRKVEESKDLMLELRELRLKELIESNNWDEWVMWEHYLAKIEVEDYLDKLEKLLILTDIIRDRFNPVLAADKDDSTATGWGHQLIRTPLAKCGGVVYGFKSNDFYSLEMAEFGALITLTFVDAKQYISERFDCDNFAVAFKGISSYVVGKTVAGIGTGGLFPDEYCMKPALGYHAWNLINAANQKPLDESIWKYQNFRIYCYEPQTDEFNDDGHFTYKDKEGNVKDLFYRLCCGFIWIW